MGTSTGGPRAEAGSGPPSPPLLLLDIDGVLNVLGPAGDARQVRIQGYQVVLPRWHRQAVLDLEAHGFEIMWSTMWMEDARTHFAPEAGFGASWRHVDFDRHWRDPALARQIERLTRGATGSAADHGSVGSYKHPGFMAAVGDRPAVVVDDDLQPWQHAWALRRSDAGIPTLTVQPDPSVGLTREHVDLIVDFARSHRLIPPARPGPPAPPVSG